MTKKTDEIVELLLTPTFRQSVRELDAGALAKLGYDLTTSPNLNFKVVTSNETTLYMTLSGTANSAVLNDSEMAGIQAASSLGSAGCATTASTLSTFIGTLGSASTASTAATAGSASPSG